jgi:hypothetical protein
MRLLLLLWTNPNRIPNRAKHANGFVVNVLQKEIKIKSSKFFPLVTFYDAKPFVSGIGLDVDAFDGIVKCHVFEQHVSNAGNQRIRRNAGHKETTSNDMKENKAKEKKNLPIVAPTEKWIC